MTPAEREAERVSIVFHAATAALGIKATAEALSLWQEVSTAPAQLAPSATKWLARALRVVALQRGQARALAYAYVRLVRALHTGRTLVAPGTTSREPVTLAKLRREFYSLVEDATPEALPNGRPPSSGGSDPVDQEPITGLDDALTKLDDDADDEAALNLQALGAVNLAIKIRKLEQEIKKRELKAQDADRKRQELHQRVGSRQASASARLVQDGARDLVHTIVARDKRAVAYIRYSTTGTPCGWCAMLISRGPVYKNEATATRDSEGQTYHDNCACAAMPIYHRNQYNESSLFSLNREYSALWPKVTRGLSGKAALAKWRKHFRDAQSDQVSA